MRLTDLQQLFAEHGIRPNKKLGQCFLIDDNISRWIVDQAEIGPDDVVVEVGPGAGALTRHLAGNCRKLVLVEKDAKLAALLKVRFADMDSVEVVHGDAVEYDVRPLFLEGPVKLIGNLPYSVGNEILRNFLSPPSPVESAVVMVQKEVAERLCAKPNTKDWGILGLMIQERWEPDFLKTIGPQPFFPRPEIDSSIVKLTKRSVDSLPTHCPQVFESFVRRGFSQRRKQLRKNLGIDAETWAPIVESLGISSTVRAEELSLRQWVDLSNLADPHPAGVHAQSGEEIFDVVDENDQVIRQEKRAVVHNEGLLHRAVHIFVFNRAGELYLQQRSMLKDTHGGKWGSSCSGHVDGGETYADSAVRELEEELFLRSKEPLEFLGRLPAGPETDQEFVEIYRTTGKASAIRYHGNEIDAGGFFPVELVERWIQARPEDFTPGFLSCFRGFLGGADHPNELPDSAAE